MIVKFLKKYLIFSVIIFAIAFFPVVKSFDNSLAIGMLYNCIVFFVLVLTSTLIMLKYATKDPSKFQTLILLSVFAKMIIAVVYFYFVFNSYENDLIAFTMSFFLSYLIFTLFEVVFLVSYLRKNL
ncbi:MAG: hypothetical protein U9R42_07380 [Bacteroidota bacterium]|nr:hypothetical protein [Bacteroidota bacterium]